MALLAVNRAGFKCRGHFFLNASSLGFGLWANASGSRHNFNWQNRAGRYFSVSSPLQLAVSHTAGRLINCR